MAEEPAVRFPEPEEIERLQATADLVRRASRDGQLLLLDDLAREFSADEPERLAELLALAWPAELSEQKPVDLVVQTQGERVYLYSEQFMTGRYAETAAQAASGNHLATIAAAVRFDSQTYPRPTAAQIFLYEPFSLTLEQVNLAFKEMSELPEYADIQPAWASNGALYLFSTAHLVPELAQSLAEWEAVGQFNSP